MSIFPTTTSYWCDDRLVGNAPTRADRGTWVGLALQEHGNNRCRWLDFTVRAFESPSGGESPRSSEP